MTIITSADLQPAQAVVLPTRSRRAVIGWTTSGLFLAIALVATLALSFIGSVAYQPLASRQRVFTASITAVTVDVRGEITVASTAGPDTVVTTSGVHGLTFPSDDERVVGSTLVIHSSCGSTPFNDRCSRNYRLELRPGVALTADSGEGNVNITGMEGPMSVGTGQGDVTIIGGSGRLQAWSGQGGVTVSRTKATSVSVRSDQGDVSVEATTSPRRITATSGQGDVTVELPRGPNSYRVIASSGQGNVSDSVNISPTSSRIVKASSGQGDVTVEYRRD